MSEILKSKAIKLFTPALVGVLGTLLALSFPVYHSAFCAGIQLPVL